MYPHAAQGYGVLIPGSEYIRSLIRQGTVSKEAARRLRWMDHYAEHGNARLTCRYFGISAPTFYRWRNRYDHYDLTTLEEESRTPGAIQSRVLELVDRAQRAGPTVGHPAQDDRHEDRDPGEREGREGRPGSDECRQRDERVEVEEPLHRPSDIVLPRVPARGEEEDKEPEESGLRSDPQELKGSVFF